MPALQSGAEAVLDYKPRIEERTKAMIRARLRGAGPERDACILDVSSRGLSVTADHPPVRGDFVELVVGDHKLVGQVKWAGSRRFGLALRQRISVIGLLSGEGGSITLKEQDAARKRADRTTRSGGAGGLARKMQFAVFFAAGALATFTVADYVGSALSSLDLAKAAMAGSAAR